MEARDQPKTGNKRRGCAGRRLRLHGAIERAHILLQIEPIEWTLLPFCEMRQTFTVLIKI